MSLDKWSTFFQILPFEIPILESIFHCVLCNYKITKFWEGNFKILGRILATPKIISHVCQEENIQYCAWYSDLATLEHILIQCPSTIEVHKQISKCLHKKFKDHTWVFGLRTTSLNPVIWLANFAIYKSHLIACDGDKVQLWDQVLCEAAKYSTIYSILLCLQDNGCDKGTTSPGVPTVI